MGNYKKLVGEKVYLSPISMDNAEYFVKWMNDFDVTDYIGRTSQLLTLESEMQWLEGKTKENGYMMTIIDISNDQIIGNIELSKINYVDRSAVLGIMIGEKENRSKGYGTEAIGLLLDFAFNYLNLNSVSLSLLEVNERAKRCYEKVGFKEFGRKRKCKFLNGKYYDAIYMDILACEFKDEYIKNRNVR